MRQIINKTIKTPGTMQIGHLLFAYTIIVILFTSCHPSQQKKDGLHFTLMKENHTNIQFNNKITESDSVNVFLNEYMYNGSGVGIADFNNDGLQDIFFAASMVSSRLYINEGDFIFKNVTETAGITTNQWCTGVSIVDINNDGFMDVYVCSSHSHDKEERKNLLFINDGKLHFTEQASAYGLADTGYSTQAAFFDYDKDGDLDMYLLNHRLYDHSANNIGIIDTSGNAIAQDRLYRNDGIAEGRNHPFFIDVSKQAGIKEDGYGLGVVLTDMNNDNWPDVYVANDYIGNDILWQNNKDGSFSNIIASSVKHQSYNSMGVDAADINNDGLIDIGVLDMVPEYNERKKMMFNATSQDKYEIQQRMGYQRSFVRNVLQLNNGIRNIKNKPEPFFSEIGQLAGISETDWSWSILMADFDNDGWKDIHITNGLAKDVTNYDYAAFKNTQVASNYTFGGKQVATAPDKNTLKKLRENLDEYGGIKVSNYLYHCKSDLSFSDITREAGLDKSSVSNGAAYADLDNDGDLDLIVNNMNEPAFIYRNEARTSLQDSNNNFIAVQLKGPSKNSYGLMSKVTLYNKNNIQYAEQSPIRGYTSSVDYRIYFGISNNLSVDSIKIEWPDNKQQVVRNIKANTTLLFDYKNATSLSYTADVPDTGLFTDITDVYDFNFSHKESEYSDYASQRGLPQKFSRLGPCMTTGDINGDGLEDFFVGGAAYQPGKLFFQQNDGSFLDKNLVDGFKQEEDLGAILFDADNDTDLDLFISGGSNEFNENSNNNLIRLYTNDGKGNFTLNTTALPRLSVISKAVAAADYDSDGDMDIFIGAYISAQKYPVIPRSFLLQNNKGVFTDVTKDACSVLQFPGMITSALWSDFNKDGQPDLVIAGEWMPVRFFKNQPGKLIEVTDETGLNNNNGMWRSLSAVDIDNDGHTDYIAGNMGTNNKYHTSAERPMMFYAKDGDNNGTMDLIPAYYIKNAKGIYDLYPAIDRNQLADQLPVVKKKYLLHKDYAETTMQKLVQDLGNGDWEKLKCETTATVWFENKANGKFIVHMLPVQAQFAPVNTIIADDVNDDGFKDILLAGNEYDFDVTTGSADASFGSIFINNGEHDFKLLNAASSGLIMDGEIKNLKKISTINNGEIIIAAVNNSRLKVFKKTDNK